MSFPSRLSLADLDASTGFVLTGGSGRARSGTSVAGAGDVNGDGIDDILVGAPFATGDSPSSGAAYVVFGRATLFPAEIDLARLDADSGIVLGGAGGGSETGISVSPAGDVNGDGIDDVVVGAPNARVFVTKIAPGAAYVVFGSGENIPGFVSLASLDGASGFALADRITYDAVGFSVSGGGDFNGDGFADVVAGGPEANSGSDLGKASVVFGTDQGFDPTLDTSQIGGLNGFTVFGDASQGSLGQSVSFAGDVNGDGFDDLIIGAPAADFAGRTDAGQAYVVFGRPSPFGAVLNVGDLDGTNGFAIGGVDAVDGAGHSVSGAGDVNGDGLDDLIVGALRAGPSGVPYSGQTFILFGSEAGFPAEIDLDALDPGAGVRLDGLSEDDFSGVSVSGAGDVNGDGIADVIIGAFGGDPSGRYDAGESFVVFGRRTPFPESIDLGALGGTDGFVIDGAAPADQSGAAVSGAGDVNGDGIDDLIVGANGAGSEYSGESYVIFGRSDADTALRPGVPDTTPRGNLFDGATDDDGVVTARFQGGQGDVTLTFSGFDVDTSQEIEVQLNGRRIGLLPAGQNDGLSPYSFRIPASAQNEGLNLLSFVQLTNPIFKWGVTDLLILPRFADIPLGRADGSDAALGNLFDGAVDADGVVTASFPGSAGPQRLFVDGFDIDTGDEVEVLLNGESLGFLPVGPNDGIRRAAIDIPAGEQLPGNNLIAFVQRGNPAFKWGVADVAVVPSAIDATLGVGRAVRQEFGQAFGAATDADGVVTARFNGTGTDLFLSFAGFDIDTADEVEILLNGESLGFLPPGANDREVPYVLPVLAEDQLAGGNLVSFVQRVNPAFKWGVTDLRLLPVEAEVTIPRGRPDTTEFGNAFGSATDADGVITADFDGGDEDLFLSFAGFDVDSGDEVEVLLNGESLGFLPAGTDNGETGYGLFLPVEEQRHGQNLVSFVQSLNPGLKWGITDLRTLPSTPDIELTPGIPSLTTFGSGVGVEDDEDGIVTVAFENPGKSQRLIFEGIDIDNGMEVEVLLNGRSRGFLAAGVNDGAQDYELLIDIAEQEPGTNVVTFVQSVNPAFKWGVGDFFLLPAEPDIDLPLGRPVAGAFGNAFRGATDADGRVSAVFETETVPLLLSFDGFDIDTEGEVEVVLNGTTIAALEAGIDNGVAPYSVVLPSNSLVPGENLLTFVQTQNPVFRWGVTDIRLLPLEPEADLAVGQTLTGEFGNAFGTAADADGVLTFGFEGGLRNLLLTLDGFDIDTGDEVEILLNGESLGFLPAGTDNSLAPYEVDLPFGLQVEGENVLSIVQRLSPALKWGVTNLSLQEAGPLAIFDLADLDGQNGFTLRGDRELSGLGVSVSGAGDIDADGIDDVLISGSQRVNIAYAVLGSADGFPSLVAVNALDPSRGFEILTERLEGVPSVSDAGDVNDDGIDDFAIGLPDASGQFKGEFGAVFVAFGREEGFGSDLFLEEIRNDVGFSVLGSPTVDLLGSSVSGAGDFNADGIDDVAFGASVAEPNGVDAAGEAYVLFGTGDGFPSRIGSGEIRGESGFTFQGADQGNQAGQSIAGAGDVNGDGFDDLLVGARRGPSETSPNRDAYVVFGTDDGLPAEVALGELDGTAGFGLVGVAASDLAGFSLSGLGDVNGDGVDDVIIGAPYADPGGLEDAGAAYVVFGTRSGFPATVDLDALDGTDGFVLTGAWAGARAGFSVSEAGDLNGDGIADLAVGSPGAGGQADTVHVVYGRTASFPAWLPLDQLDGDTGFALRGELNPSEEIIDGPGHRANAVSGAGDVNGDGVDDLILADPDASPLGLQRAGAAYVYFGSSGADVAIVPGLPDATRLGNAFEGATDEDGRVAVRFVGTGADARLDFSGFDVDTDEEIEVWLNGRSLGFLDAGADNGLSPYSLEIPSADQNEGLNLVTFVQALNPGLRWGVTDFFLATDAADIPLTPGKTDRRPFGNNFEGASDRDGVVTAGFDSTGETLTLTFAGFDIDSGAEVEVLLNGQSLGFLAPGTNDGETPYSFQLPAASQIEGFNLLSFVQRDNPLFKWGVTDVRILPSQPDIRLAPGRLEDRPFGNAFEGATDADGVVTAIFRNTGEDLRLFFDGFDIDTDEEVEVLLNGEFFATLDQGLDNREAPYVIDIGAHDQELGENLLSFVQTQNPAFRWGVTDLRLLPVTQDVGLVPGDTVTGPLGNAFNGASDADGVVNATFDGGLAPLTLSFDGFDIDTDAEVEVLLNGQSLGFLDAGVDNGLAPYSIEIPFFDQNDGQNTLSFVQALNPGLRWGVTNLRLDEAGPPARIDLGALAPGQGFEIEASDGESGGAGDINGDGLGDIFVGRVTDEILDRDPPEGFVTVYYGREGGFPSVVSLNVTDDQGVTIRSGSPNDGIENAVAAAGDVNGDGIDDLILGAENGNVVGAATGESSVVFGAGSIGSPLLLDSLGSAEGYTLLGVDPLDRAGRDVAGAGDVDGDGTGDVVIGAPFANPNGQAFAGEAYVVFGTGGGTPGPVELSDLDGSNGFVVQGLAARDALGTSVSGAGDVNGDGFDDVILGAPYAGVGGTAYVVFGTDGGFPASLPVSSLNGARGFSITRGAAGDQFDDLGESVSWAGDVNADGIDDIIVGAPGVETSGPVNGGESYVIFGTRAGFPATLSPDTLDGRNGFVIEGATEGALAGSAVSSAGDVNGDGIDDIVVGAPTGLTGGWPPPGEAYVIFGRAGSFPARLSPGQFDGTQGYILRGAEAFDRAGTSVSGLGDVDGDGVDDLLVGAPNAHNVSGKFIEFSGKSYVIHGRSEADVSLVPGLPETTRLGNAFGEATDEDGRVTARFDGGEGPVIIDFKGFDIDSDREIQVLLNGRALTFLPAGVNNGLADYTLNIPLSVQRDGLNLLTFVQTENPALRWGVTDFFLTPATADISLAIGEIAGFFGNNVANEPDGIVTLSFPGTDGDVALDFRGFDIDTDREVEILLNGESLGFLPRGVDAGFADYSIPVPQADQLPGDNLVSIIQRDNPAFVWGIDDFRVLPSPADFALTRAGLAEGLFGNAFGGATDADGLVSGTFQADGRPHIITFAGFDVDTDTELEVLVNGVSLGTVPAGVNNGEAPYLLLEDGRNLIDGPNLVSFAQTGNPALRWGVTDVRVLPATDGTDLGSGTETGEFGNAFGKATDEDGIVTFTFRNRGVDNVLSFSGFDIDTDDEVELLLNGRSLGFLGQGVNDGFAAYQFDFAVDEVIEDDTNYLTFVQRQNPAFKWGVTDLRVSSPAIDAVSVEAVDAIEFADDPFAL